MANPDKVKFIISHNGDSSVGVAGEKAEVLLDASGFNAEDRANFVENARDSLATAFASIWEFKPSVRTEAELQAEAPFEGGRLLLQGEKVRFGRNNEREIEAFAGLFRYSGFGSGTYYGLTHKVFTDLNEAQELAQKEGVKLINWDSENAWNHDYDHMIEARRAEQVVAANDSTAQRPDSAQPAGVPFTVIGHDEYERTLFIEHVVATDGLNAFAVAASKYPEAEFSVAIEGTLTEEGNVLTLPGEGLVPSGVILTSPDVFGTAQEANDGPDGP
ncbi:hypothetical protein RCH14_004449 [Massilia sp. MP_M2]|uniref:hypothetical protein n=1 Tax=Massilia sp. MP_M2 TaxID=3071713 RepID=UPI00319DD929